ncbi:hypothetical protein K431DRAFT_95811 [Polychaeton citri CBS 116435]|uniref:SET domain-containing protein n=1 Tax=Polychaeton citri CBS 116435 TaxID=1314669 RepID=A0A9P4Q8I8_9PEZI|nr:hypothetical protein K431DRAFT_95811 [Polychaeton citri CBS 116435]
MDADVNALAYKLAVGAELLDLTGANVPFQNVVRAVTGQDDLDLHALGIKNPDHHVCEIKGHHAPSKHLLSELEPIDFSKLKQGERHSGKAIYLTIIGKANREDSIGTYYDTQDNAGRQVTVWSMIFDPLGDSEQAWPKELPIVVKEPLFDQPPKVIGKGRPRRLQPAICVHHPQDISCPSIGMTNSTNANPDAEQACKQHLRLGNEALLRKALFTARGHFHTAAAAAELVKSPTSQHGTDGRQSKPLSSDQFDALQRLAFVESELGRPQETIRYVRVVMIMTYAELTKQKLAQWQNLLLMGAKAALKLGNLDRAFQMCAVGVLTNSTKLRQYYQHLQEREKELKGEYDWASITRQIDAGKSDLDVLSFTTNVAVRQSSIAGRGLFTNLDLEPGDLIMVDPRREIPVDQDNFNTYHVASIIQHNARVIHTGRYSDRHGEMDPAFASKPLNERSKPYTQSCGLWPKVSMANHSCYPNAVWSWIGDMIVVRATTQIKEGEEIFLSYVPSNMSYEKRKVRLMEKYGFECRCNLCIAEGSTTDKDEQIKADVDKLFRQEDAFFIGPKEELLKTPVNHALKTLCDMSTISAYEGIPIPMLALPFFQLGLMCLGPMELWRKARDEPIELATIAFNACLTTGLGIGVVKLREKQADIFCSTHSEAKRIGVLAMMALAELHFILARRERESGKIRRAHKEKSLRCQRCAKRVYQICYGEDITFENHHKDYACKKLWIAKGFNK